MAQVRRLTAVVGSLAVASAALVGWASGSTLGTVPPSDPTYYCNPQLATPLKDINYCRAKEGVGPMVLPSNYDSLTVPQQQLVVFNLERVNRGLPAIVGLNAAVNALAQQGADAAADPGFPADSGEGASIWAAESTTLGALDEWMYTDECSPTHLVGCWGHRDGILIDDDQTDPLVAGTGFTANGWHSGSYSANSYAAEFLYGYHSDQLVFTWASELSYFPSPPATEPLNGPTPSPSPSATPSATPTPTPTPSVTPTPTATSTATPTATATATPTATATTSPTSSRPVLQRLDPNESARPFGRFPGRLAAYVSEGGDAAAGVPVTFKAFGHCSFAYGKQTVVRKTDANGEARAPVLYSGNPGKAHVTASATGGNTITWRLRVTR